MTDTRSDKERWNAVLDALSDDVARMPDEMVLREYAQTANEDIEKVSGIIKSLIGEVDITPYKATQIALETHRNKMKQMSLPVTPEERRSLLERIMGGGHPWSETATLAFRELDDPASLTDEDIQGILEDLAELNTDKDA